MIQVWPLAVWIVSASILLAAVFIVIVVPSSSGEWEGAIVRGTCGGLPLLQRRDGSVWLRVNSVRFYRVEDPGRLTCG